MAAWLLAGIGVAGAQQAAPGRCAGLAESAGMFVTRPADGTMKEVGPDVCRFERVRFGSERVGYEAATVLVRGLPLPENAAGAVRIEARGMKFAAHTGRAKMDWMIQQQQVSSFDVVVDFDFDPASGHLVLHELSLDGELVGRVAIEGVFEGVPAGLGMAVMTPDATPAIAVRAFRLQLDSTRFMANYLLPIVVPMLPDEGFVASFERGRALAALVATRLMTAAGAGAGDTAAVLALIREAPQPKRMFDLSFEAGTAAVPLFSLGETVEKGTGFEALLAGSHVSATYAGQAR